MCEYCRKLTQHSYPLKTGYDVNIGYEGEVFVDLFNNFIVHLEHEANLDAIEVSIPIKYCPFCGDKLEVIKHGKAIYIG